jgi:hypothetical protein
MTRLTLGQLAIEKEAAPGDDADIPHACAGVVLPYK